MLVTHMNAMYGNVGLPVGSGRRRCFVATATTVATVKVVADATPRVATNQHQRVGVFGYACR